MLFSVVLSVGFAACPFKLMDQADPESRRLLQEYERLEEQDRLRALAPTVGTSTVEGCKCKHACGSTIDDGFNCDWCFTEGKCGHYSRIRFAYWDYCTFPTQKTYEDQTWAEKHKYLLQQVLKDPKRGNYENKLKVVSESMQTTFDNNWDWMPAGRFKVIHAVGAVCPVKMTITDGAYTGILEKGDQAGFFRFGSAINVETDGINPGAGFKFLRTGVKSANWVMLDNPQSTNVKDFNLWNRNLTNHVTAFKGAGAVVAIKFHQASVCVTKVGLSNLATYTQDGKKVDKPVFPWELQMVPTGVARMTSSKKSLDNFMKDLIGGLPSGSTFYDVYAKKAPFAEFEKIGSMTTTDKCVTSKYGDKELFFRHQRVEEDWALRPEWWKGAAEQKAITFQCGSEVRTLTPPEKCADRKVSSELRAGAPTQEPAAAPTTSGEVKAKVE